MWNPNLDTFSGPKYKRIVKALSSDVNNGKLQPNQKLPTNRELADILDVSLGTVVKALQEAKNKGLIQGQVGRGTYVREYEMNRLIELLSPESKKGNLDLSLLVPPVFTNDVLKRSLNLAAQELFNSPKLHSLLGYQSHLGNLGQRKIFAELLSTYHPSDAENIAICQSSQNALAMLLSHLAKPGDTIMAESVTDPGILDAAQMYNLKLEGLELDEYGIIPTSFESACQKGNGKILYCIPTFQNPTTAVMPVGRRKAMANIAKENDVTILENGTLNWLCKTKLPSISSFVPDITYFFTSFSKAISPSIRLGLVRSSEKNIKEINFVLRSHIWMASPILAEIICFLIEHEYFDEIRIQNLIRAERNQLIAEDILGKYKYRNQPTAYHMWLELPDSIDSQRFTSQLDKKGINVASGSVFSVNKSVDPNAIRIGLNSAIDEDNLRTALQKIYEMLEEER